MSYSPEQIAALRAAIATGAMKVRNANGEEVTYRSLAEMKETLARMEREAAGLPRPAFYQPSYSRGTGA